MKSLFFGGVHPADKKELSANAEVKTAKQPAKCRSGRSMSVEPKQ